jgi:hypothetical protein
MRDMSVKEIALTYAIDLARSNSTSLTTSGLIVSAKQIEKYLNGEDDG